MIERTHGRVARDPETDGDRALEDLLNGLCDGMLSEADEDRLARLLEADAVARRRYREWLELHASLQWDYAAAAARWDAAQAGEGGATVGSTAGVRSGRASWWTFAGASLAAAGLVMGLLWFGSSSTIARSPVVELTSLGGAASWSHAGRVVTNLAVGDRLPLGTVCLEGEAAFMRLVFRDGSAVTLSGPSMLEFADQGQKRLVLRHGSLSVDARPQPPGKPMKILTPTAEVEVVGTVFSVSVDSDETRLGVEQGKVKLRRLADGRSVEVPQDHVATASLESSRPIAVRRPEALPDDYAIHFEVDPGWRCQGEWLEPEPHGDLGTRMPGRLRAVPRVAGHRPDGAPIVHYGVAVPNRESGVVSFHAESVVVVRFRMEVPRAFRVMLTMRRPGGGFAGNCQVVLPVDAGAERIGPGGWREVEIPARALQPITDFHPLSPEPYGVGLLLVDAFDRDANLEVSELSIRRRLP